LRKELLEILVEISEKMNNMFEIHNLLPAIINIAKEYLDVKRISLMLIEDEALRIYAHAGFDIDPENVDIPMGEGISGKVAETGVEVIVNNLDDTREEMGYQAKSFASVPLKKNDKVLGVLNLTDKEGDFFTDEDVKIARYIASQCALGVERFNLYKEMRKSESLKVIGMLNSSIAHDIKNLLGIVQSYIELIHLEPDLPEEIQEYIDNIFSEVKRIHGLTLDLLDFSRQRVTINMNRFKVSLMVDDISKHANILTRDTDIEVDTTLPEDFEMELDREKLFRVLFNLVANSIDALIDKGKVKLTTEKIDDKCVFKVWDNGPGIREENRKKIFDPFFTLGKAKGTGLGLAIVKMIIEAHNGNISVDSQEGEFTEFKIEMPIRYEPNN